MVFGPEEKKKNIKKAQGTNKGRNGRKEGRNEEKNKS